jgi:hypothetical protein
MLSESGDPSLSVWGEEEVRHTFQSNTCVSRTPSSRGVIEARVLAAFGGLLMQPELLDDLIAAYHEESGPTTSPLKSLASRRGFEPLLPP